MKFKNKKAGAFLHFYTNKNKLLKCKKAFDMPFSWLFSIIVGAVIIFIAIYATINFINTSSKLKYSESAQELLNQLNPVVNGISSSFATKINFKKETRIELTCTDTSFKSAYFGKESLSFSEESGFIKKWLPSGEPVSRYNKYIFSDSIGQGKELFIFSKPFYVGYRVDDLVMMNFNKYCLIDSPSIVQEEIESINLGNFNLSTGIASCPKNYMNVCFGFDALGCNISVIGTCSEGNCESNDYETYKTGYVSKGEDKVYYYKTGLLYAAIFSSPDIYECNIKRLGKKAAELGQVYREKIDIVKLKDCNSVIGTDLEYISSGMKTINSSLELIDIYSKVESMDRITCTEDCKIYSPEDC